MKAKELRIGNLVKIHGNIETVFGIIKDQPISQSSAIFTGVMVEDKTEYWLDSVSPIPLTEEWLIKFGFRDGNEGFADEWNKWFKDGLELEPFMDHFEMYINECVYIKYVHQLQNLYFALTNEELTF